MPSPILYGTLYRITEVLEQGWPTRGPHDKLVRPFFLLLSFTLFFKDKKIFRKKKIFGEANLVERAKNFEGVGFYLKKTRLQKKGHQKN